jgi:hypothetical protein
MQHKILILVIFVIKYYYSDQAKRTTCVGHVECISEMCNAYKILINYLTGIGSQHKNLQICYIKLNIVTIYV